MEADESGRTALDALNGRKSEILDIFLSVRPSFASVAQPTFGNLVLTADSRDNVPDPEPVARERVAVGRPQPGPGSLPHPGSSGRPLDKEPYFRSMKQIKGRFSAGAAQPTNLEQGNPGLIAALLRPNNLQVAKIQATGTRDTELGH